MEPLSPVQVRILGCLIEKERTTPDNYPLTMNGLLGACNQTTNRHPVLTLGEATVASALENLRAADLVRIVYSRSNRADKYRHVLEAALGLDPAETAVVAVLMLRGPQTVAELRSRTERVRPFVDLAEVESALTRLAGRSSPLVTRLERGAGQKEARWAHLLAGQPDVDDGPPAPASTPTPRAERLEALETAVAGMRQELERLRADHEKLAARMAASAAERPPA